MEGPMERRKNNIDVWKDTWIDRYLDLPALGRAFLIGLLAAALGFALDGLAHLLRYHWITERLFENIVEGFIIGFVVFWLSRARDKRMERRMREIGFLNHHIRNAMQAIELAAKGVADAQQRVAVIELSIQRVMETLSRISRESDELSLEGRQHYAA
jgi:hypothetical protein